MTTPYVTTLETDRRDTDHALALSSADQFAVAIDEWEACPYHERAAYLAGLSDEARAAVEACIRLDGLTVREELAAIGEMGRERLVEGRKHLSVDAA